MKKFKRVFIIVLVFTFVAGIIPVNASNHIDMGESTSSSMSKLEFANYCESIVGTETYATEQIDEDQLSHLLHLYNTSSGTARDLYELELNSYGYYIYPCAETTPDVELLSEPANVTISTVSIVHNPYNDTWVLSASGRWLDDDAIKSDANFAIYGVGSSKIIGGRDVVGISIYDVNGDVPARISSYAVIYSNQGETKPISNPSDQSTYGGVSFEYDDRITVTQATAYDYAFDYMGYEFTVSETFDSNFANWSGKAVAFYGHTWSSTSVTGVNFSIDPTTYAFGFGITWDNTSNKFEIKSSGVATF